MTKKKEQRIETLTCKRSGCSITFEHDADKPGRKPSFCERHRRKDTRKRARQAIADHMSPEEAEEFDRKADPDGWVAKQAAESSYDSILPRLMAWGMSIHKAPSHYEQAARAAGIFGRSKKELQALAEVARREHSDIIEMKQSAVAKEAQRTMVLYMLLAQAKAHQCSPSQLASSAKNFAAVAPEGQTQYSDVTIKVNLPERKAQKKK